ncbi:MAG TPA: efflux RND transporter periplasmic adaptor subunit [Rhizomicrobium sp.]|nr:efflux RND transporter periplasmic adaptor subunit [Rhizomicrobium sp.]
MPGLYVKKSPFLPAARPIVVVVCASLLLALAACGQSGGQRGLGNRKPDVGVIVIRYQPALLTAELPGRTSPYREADVRPQVNGIVTAQLFDQGSTIRAGQALYQIDPAPYRAAVENAKGALANAQANLATAKAKAQRYAMLLKQNAIAPQDYDDAQAAWKQAQANVEQNGAALESAKINLGYTTITAPISGHIGRSLVTVGALVTANQTSPLATIETLDPIYVDINQSTAELLGLKKAMASGRIADNTPESARVTLTLEDGSDYPFNGILKVSEVSVDPNTGAVVLRAVFPNPKGILLPGMYVRARIVEGVDRHAILAPQQGISRDEKGEPTALIVDAKGIVQLKVLRAPRAVGGFWLVTAGLEPGDRLIVDGLQNARPGQAVHAVPASIPVAPAPTDGT